MPYRWPVDTDFAMWELDVLDRDCPVCGHRMHVSDHKSRHFHILNCQLRLSLPTMLAPLQQDTETLRNNTLRSTS